MPKRSSLIAAQSANAVASVPVEFLSVDGGGKGGPIRGVLETAESFVFINGDEDALNALEEKRLQKPVDHWGSQFVVLEQNRARKWWAFAVALCLAYIGTVFLYQISFLEFHIPRAIEPSGVFQVLVLLSDGVFYVDLFVNFFFSYRDADGVEVDSLRLVVVKYLFSYQFPINVFACLPHQVFDALFSGSGANRAARIVRLQRLTKLFRLFKLSKIAHFLRMPIVERLMKNMANYRGLHIMNFVVGLFWAVHVLGCGWYLCGVLIDDPDETWLARRSVDVSGSATLLTRDAPELQWLHSMYFVMTIFTTVGFGDISAFHEIEICYIFLCFMIGSIVNSVIMGEVINICMKDGDLEAFVRDQKSLVDHFSNHMQFSADVKNTLSDWVDSEAADWLATQYDKDSMKSLIHGRFMARDLMIQLPALLFKGELGHNLLFRQLADRIEYLPPRLPILFAMAAYQKHCHANEVIYQRQDLANNLFLVMSGTFAHVGIPTTTGGKDVRFLTEDMQGGRLFPYKLFSRRSYFGDECFKNENHRVATVRCEVQGQVLVVPSGEVCNLLPRFPELCGMWRKEAIRREMHRESMKTWLCAGHGYRHFAARAIQRYVRHRRRKAWKSEPIAVIAACFAKHRYGAGKQGRRLSFANNDENGEADIPLLERSMSQLPPEQTSRSDLQMVVEELRHLRSGMVSLQSQVSELAARKGQQGGAQNYDRGNGSNAEMQVVMGEIRALRSDMTATQKQVQIELHAMSGQSTSAAI